MRLSEQLPAPELERNEWYNDFVLKSGVRDIVAAQVSDTGSHTVVFGFHEGIGEKPLCTSHLKRLDQLLEPLHRAAEVQLRLRELGWKSAVVARAFDQVSTGVIVVDAHGFVIEMNELAERVVRRGDGLMLQHGALGAARVFETAKLSAAIVSATRTKPAATSSRLLIGRQGSKHDYILAVSPLDVDLGFTSDSMALIIVVDPEARSPKADDLSAYFGLSLAESRLATQLMSGKPLGAIAAESGAVESDAAQPVALHPEEDQGRTAGRPISRPRQSSLLPGRGSRRESESAAKRRRTLSVPQRQELRRFFLAYGLSPPERIERRIGTPMRPKVSRRPLTR